MTLDGDANFEEKLKKNLTRALKILEICTLIGYFCQKYISEERIESLAGFTLDREDGAPH